MADHSKPVLTDNYTNVLDQVRGRFEDQAKGFDPANTSATNIQTNTIRWTSASNKWQKWNGTSWVDLSSLYAINISGNAGTVTNGVYTTGDQTIGGTKTFSSLIQGSVSGNSGTVTNGVYTVGNQTIAGIKTFSDSTIVNGNLGVGTSSPTINSSGKTIHLHASGTNQWSLLHTTNGETGGFGGDGAIFGQIGFDSYVFNYEVGNIVFGTSGSPRMTLDSNGKLILSAANQGIQFADGTTQTTASSSGSYTPALGGISSGLSIIGSKAQWTKVGRVVTVKFEASITTTSAAQYSFDLTLPFTPSFASGSVRVAGAVGGAVTFGTVLSTITGDCAVVSTTNALCRLTTAHGQGYTLCTSFSYEVT